VSAHALVINFIGGGLIFECKKGNIHAPFSLLTNNRAYYFHGVLAIFLSIEFKMNSANFLPPRSLGSTRAT